MKVSAEYRVSAGYEQSKSTDPQGQSYEKRCLGEWNFVRKT
jgi:hypothetical protein